MADEQDKVIALRPWDIAVRRASSRKHAHALLDRQNADETIRALTELETYYVVKELGIESSLPVLSMLEPHQICALVDLDIWHDDQPDLDDLLLWLEAFRETDLAQLVRAVRSIDPELFALLLRRRLHIAPIAKDDEPTEEWVTNAPDSILPLIETPDRRFVIAARSIDEAADEDAKRDIDEDSRKLILELVDLLYKDEDFESIATALKVAHDDLSSSLEQEAHRFRTSRLEDLGFPEVTRALALYAPIDPEKVLEARDKHLIGPDLSLPALHAGRFAKGLFHEVMEAVDSPDTVRRVEGELLALANAAAVADRVEPGDLDRLREVLDRVRSYLELALSYRTDPAKMIDIGKERIETHAIRTLFQVGFGITLELGRRAKKLRASNALRAGGEPFGLLTDEERLFLSTLEEQRPRFSIGGGVPRAFSSELDVARTRALLDELFELASAIDEVGFADDNEALTGALDPPIAQERNADMLLATAAANVLLDRGFEVIPLDRADLDRVRKRLERGRFPKAAIDRAVAAVTPQSVRSRITRGMRALEDALSPLVGEGEIDPRFIGVVVRRLH